VLSGGHHPHGLQAPWGKDIAAGGAAGNDKRGSSPFFRFRASDFLRISDFGFRASDGSRGPVGITEEPENAGVPPPLIFLLIFLRAFHPRPLYKTPDFMDIQVATLCDAATDSQGKLNILGTFDTINAGQMPATHPQCSVALRIVFDKMEEGDHQVRLNFVDEDGKSVVPPIDMPVHVEVPDEAIFISRNFIVNIQNLKFERPGFYSVDVSLGGEIKGRVPLLVRYVPSAPPPHPSFE
jgi:hypothetical protein